MRRQQQRFGAVLWGAALLLGIAPAVASPLAPVSLLPALDVYVDALAAGHNAALACAAVWPPMKVTEAGWTQARSILVATLWANDFPIDFVRTATQRLDAPPGAKPDCTHIDPALAGQLGWPGAEAELRDSCLKDQAVQANLANFGFGGLGAAIDKLLPAASSDGGSN